MALDKILLAVDDSEYGRKATALLEDFFRYNPNLSATVVNVVEPVAALIGNGQRDDVKGSLRVEASQMVAHTVKQLHQDGMHTQVRIEEGDVADTILSIADEIGANLIIMGAKGKGKAGVLMGSVSQKVMQKSGIPILVAK